MQNNSDNNESYYYNDPDCAYLEVFQFYVWGVVSNIINVVGVIGNILSIIVMRNRRMRSSMSYYLISLALYDCTVLIAMSLLMGLPTWYIYSNGQVLQGYMAAFPTILPYCYPLALIGQTGTIYTTVALTVERYVAVCHPFKAANTCTFSRTKKTILLIFLCSTIYNVPRFLERETVYTWNEGTNTTEPNLVFTEFGQSSTYKEVYFIYCNLFVMFLLPLTSLSVMNFFLIRTIRRSSKMRQAYGSGNLKDKNLTVMLIAIIIVFLICQLLPTVDNTLWTVLDVTRYSCSIPYIQFTTISNMMVVMNSAVNFILYCLFGKKFRQVLILMLCPCLKKKDLKSRASTRSRYQNGSRYTECESGFV